ncbi:MAG TPA: cardiolipin synthase [Ruminiclostridium sp.]|nr:cardiolipin synthase [Ruminiclostridium sp.]
MSKDLFSVLSIIIIIANSIFIITAILFERKKPIRALSWILALTLLPVAGFVLYLVFGRPINFKKKKFHIKNHKDVEYSREIYRTLGKVSYDETMFSEPYNDYVKQLINFNINLSQSPFTNDNRVEIFTKTQEKYDALLRDIEGAETSIHMLYFIIKNDSIGSKIINALALKAKAGVTVRVLFDHGQNLLLPYNAFKPIIDSGGEALSFFSNSIDNYLKANYRNHRKIVVIDGKIGYVGGINIGDEYLGYHKRITPWRDTHLRITGSSVYCLQLRFMTDWIYASKKEVDFGSLDKYFRPISSEDRGNVAVQMVSSGPDTNAEEVKRGIVKMINSAKCSILIQTPYFVPDDSVLEALQNAAVSGVNVIIQIPEVPDKRLVYKVTTSFIEDVMEFGVKVFLYPGFLHAKMIVIDDTCCSIGSANMDMRSFSLDFEINAFMYGHNITEKCSGIFYNDLKTCRLVTEESYKNRGVISKVTENICRLLSPLL